MNIDEHQSNDRVAHPFTLFFFQGGSISHHHGIGKIRSKWYKQSVSSVGVDLYKSAKKELDPRNIFATGNLLTEEDAIDFDKEIKSKL